MEPELIRKLTGYSDRTLNVVMGTPAVVALTCTQTIHSEGKDIRCENIAARVDMRTQECYCEACWKSKKKMSTE